MSRGGLLTLLGPSLAMKGADASWPRKIVRDTAYLFLPFAFAAFLLLLGGALLITWGRLSNAVLVGFCVTAGILIGLFIICHLALYCTWVKEKADRKHTDDSGSSPQGSVLDARSVKIGSPRVCRSCLGGLSVHVPAVATFGGVTGRLEPVIEEAPEEGEPSRPVRAEQSPQQTQLASSNERQNGTQASSPPAGQTQAENPDTMEDELRAMFLRPMSHLSAMVAPLNVTRAPKDCKGSLYTFQHPASPRPDTKGGPGILIPSRSEQVNQHSFATSLTSPAVLNNMPQGISAAPKPARHARADAPPQLTTSRPVLTTSQSRDTPPRTPPLHSTTTAQGRTQQQEEHQQHQQHQQQRQQQQTAPKIGSPLRHIHQFPYSPQDFNSPSPYRPCGPRVPPRNESEQLSRTPMGDTTRRHQAMWAHHERAQRPMRNHFRPMPPPHSPSNITEQTHVVRFREPDLAGLIARGVLKVNPESGPPAWMLGTYGRRLSAGSVEVLENGERRTVELREGGESAVRRGRSRRAVVESVGGGGDGCRFLSNDSGYYTASSGLLSGSTVGRLWGPREEDCFQNKEEPILPSFWGGRASSASSDGERRVLRRRSSVPELGRRYRVERDGAVDDAGDEGSLDTKEQGGYEWDNETGSRSTMARVSGTGRRRVEVRSMSNVSISEAEREIV